MITVTASVTFTYDPADGLVDSVEDAVSDVADILHRLSPDDFTYTTEIGN